jgi:hypothetical protein
MKGPMIRPHTLITSRLIATLVFAALLSAVPFHAALAATAPDLRTAGSFAILGGPAVTCTAPFTVTGDVGAGFVGGVVTPGGCAMGTVHSGDTVAQNAYIDFLSAYNNLPGQNPCGTTLTALSGNPPLAPGVYCVSSFDEETDTVLTLSGPSNGIWVFRIGASDPTGYLTGTRFSVVMEGGGLPCNVYWWVGAAATMTDSNFLGTILAGAAISVTRGTFDGSALAQAAVTLVGPGTLTGCEQAGHAARSRCNQGVGNGPENNCDPGNSNQGDPSRSNDELGGTPGNPGRKGGKK